MCFEASRFRGLQIVRKSQARAEMVPYALVISWKGFFFRFRKQTLTTLQAVKLEKHPSPSAWGYTLGGVWRQYEWNNWGNEFPWPGHQDVIRLQLSHCRHSHPMPHLQRNALERTNCARFEGYSELHNAVGKVFFYFFSAWLFSCHNL